MIIRLNHSLACAEQIIHSHLPVMLTTMGIRFHPVRTDKIQVLPPTHGDCCSEELRTEENVNWMDFKCLLEEGLFFLINLSKASFYCHIT